MDLAGFDALLAGADLVVTGEGRLDGQSLAYGKAVAGIAERVDGKGIPVCALVGGMGPGGEAFLTMSPRHSVMVASDGPMPLNSAMEQAEELYRSAARRMFRMLRVGMSLGL